jgi:dCMP deaminase
MRTFVIGYVPVIHKGYLNLFEKYRGKNSFLYVFGEEIINSFRHLRKDVRAANPKDVAKMAEALKFFRHVDVALPETLKIIPKGSRIIMPCENISKTVAQKYFIDRKVIFSPIFLRWNSDKAKKEQRVDYDYAVSCTELTKEMFGIAYKEAERSSDWWRQVGAVVVKDKKIIFSAYNKHLPSEHTPYIVGDPRGEFHKGIFIELSSAIHAEAALISSAAKRGISLFGTDLYVTTFPCPVCARYIAYSGIKRVFFREGYSMLDAKDILNSFGVKTIYVKNKTPSV